MRQKGNEARREAKALQWKMQTITDTEERKQVARQMNELFALAKALRDEAKHRRWFEQSVEREFNGISADMDKD